LSLNDVVGQLRELHLLTEDQLSVVSRDLTHRFRDAADLAAELLRRGWLTSFQSSALLYGQGKDLLLGNYFLLGKLGRGGMGEVFKARNWKLGTLVALKVIHRSRFADPHAVRRFLREIEAAGRFDHPHIVRALDAEEVGGTLCLVLELVEGID